MYLKKKIKLVTVMKVQYLIVVPVILLACGKVMLQGMISRNYLKNVTDVTLYNAIVFGGMAVIYLLLNGLNMPLPGIFAYGSVYGLTLAAFQIVYTMAMQRGPMSHTVLIASFNNIFSITFGILYCNETLKPLNIVGLLCMFLSLLLTVDFKQAKNHRFNITWFLLSLSAMALNGFSNVLLKIQKMTIPDQDMGMLLVTHLTGTAALLLFYFFQSKVRKHPKKVVLHPSRVMLMLSVSLILGTYFVLYMVGVGTLPSVIYFPLISIGPTTLISLFGVFVFKDNLSRQQVLSLLFGISATLLLCF